MRLPWTRVAVVLAGALALAAGLFWLVGSGGGVPAATSRQGLSNKEALVGLLTLGVLGLALYGFDLRDWF